MNWNLIGHEWAVNLLKQHIASGSVRHAYLFTGPQGVGRRTLAIRLAQALNCPQPSASGEACGVCQTCHQIEHMQYPDLEVIQAEQRGGTLRVDQVRELQRHVALAPYQGKYRVALLLFFEEANANTANALLKILEEPPAQVVIILTAESAELLLPTIVSRCEVIRLRPLPQEQVSKALQERWDVPAGQATLLASISGGRPGYAMHLYQDPDQLDMRRKWLEEHKKLLTQSLIERFRYAERVAKDREIVRNILLIWLSFWRDVLIRASGAKTPLVNLDKDQEIQELAQQVGISGAHRMIANIERILGLLERNINVRLACEVLMLDLPKF